MIEKHKAIIEKMAEEKFPETNFNNTTHCWRSGFVKGAAAMDELIQKDYHSKSLFDLADEIERLKKLLEASYKAGVSVMLTLSGFTDFSFIDYEVEQNWEQFCKENDITIPQPIQPPPKK